MQYEEREVVGFPYVVSTNGDVWSLAGRNRVVRKTRRLLRFTSNTYQRMQLVALDGTKRVTTRHRLIAETLLPNPLGLPEVNHKNGRKGDNRIENLEWVTHQENIQHAWQMGLMDTPKRRRSRWKKLTLLKAMHIAKSPDSQKELARRYKVDQSRISQIRKRYAVAPKSQSLTAEPVLC